MSLLFRIIFFFYFMITSINPIYTWFFFQLFINNYGFLIHNANIVFFF